MSYYEYNEQMKLAYPLSHTHGLEGQGDGSVGNAPISQVWGP